MIPWTDLTEYIINVVNYGNIEKFRYGIKLIF